MLPPAPTAYVQQTIYQVLVERFPVVFPLNAIFTPSDIINLTWLLPLFCLAVTSHVYWLLLLPTSSPFVNNLGFEENAKLILLNAKFIEKLVGELNIGALVVSGETAI